MTVMKYESLTTRALRAPQLYFLAKECLDFSNKPNPKDWAVITVQCAPTDNWSSNGFPVKYVNKNAKALEKIVTTFNRSSTCGVHSSGDFGCEMRHSFISRGGKVLAGIYSGYDTDASAVISDIQRIACKDSTLVSEDTDGCPIICEIFSISRKAGRIDVIRGGAGESRSYSFEPSAPAKRNEKNLFIDYSETYSITPKNGSTYIMKRYSVNQYSSYGVSFCFESDIDFDFRARVILYQTADSLEVAYPKKVKFTGTDTSNGHFSPRPNHRYTIDFWYDGIINAHVRGVSMV